MQRLDDPCMPSLVVFAKRGLQPGNCEREAGNEKGNDETPQVVRKQEKKVVVDPLS